MLGQNNNQSADRAAMNRASGKQDFADLAAQIAAAIRSAARSANRDTGASLTFSRSMGVGDGIARLDVDVTADAVNIVGELVRAEFRGFDFASVGPSLGDLLCLEIEPFVIGVGWVKVLDTANGIVLRRAGFKPNAGRIALPWTACIKAFLARTLQGASRG